MEEAQKQFDDLTSMLGIPGSWDHARKLEILRGKSPEELVQIVERMKMKFFRPILDGEFMSEDLFTDLFSGAIGKRMKELGIQTIIGDLTQEFHLYKMVYPPNSYESLVDRLSWDYPRNIAVAVSEPFKSQPRSDDEWKDIFGRLYADLQIHSTMRGFIQSIGAEVPLDRIHRYRIDWRTQSVDKRLPPEVGATHGTDMSIWFFGNGDTLTESEKSLIRQWLTPVAAFLKGEDFDWGTRSLTEVKYLTAEAEILIKEDEVWEEKLSLWDITKQVTNSRRMQSRRNLSGPFM